MAASRPASSDLASSIARYAERMHAAAGREHHVASPIGAWLILALVGPAAQGEPANQLGEALGMDFERAAAAAAALLSQPHPLVSAGTALWARPDRSTLALDDWLRRLPKQVARGPLPSQAAADRWASKSTGGQIRSFPLQRDPLDVVVMASALASQVKWDQPFELGSAAEFGTQSSWPRLSTPVLRSPVTASGHHCWIGTSRRAGDIAVHTAGALGGGLEITSVIASPEVPVADVMAAAHSAAGVAASDDVEPRSLFDLSLGESDRWTINAQPSTSPGEEVVAVLPAWTARTQHQLLGMPGLAFDAAGQALQNLLPPEPRGYETQAQQTAAAAFTQMGFKAAAVTGIKVKVWSAPRRSNELRKATLRFGHPYAVVAVARKRNRVGLRRAYRGPWVGLPVFSAWVADPSASFG